MKKQFTTGEVADFCGVTLRTVISWIKAGRLEAYQLPGTRGDNRIRMDALLHFMHENRLPIPEQLLGSDKALSQSMLIVDDDPLMARSIERIGRRCGFDTYLAFNGFSAGRLFAEIKPRFMTLDLQMPRLDGFEVLESLKENNSCTICVISGMGQACLQKAMEIRANYALPKPYDPAQLASLINSVHA